MSPSPPADALTLPDPPTPTPPPVTPRVRPLGIHGPRQPGPPSYLTLLPPYRKTDPARLALRAPAPTPPPVTPRGRRLGILGPRQSGKTSYLTVLHHYRKTDSAGVVMRDEATLRYLEELWNRYLAAGLPVPRTAGLPTELQLDLQAAGQTWEVLTRDYPGERVQRPVHEEALAWLESCDAILVFLDIT